jgi:hypothetical protein
MSRPKPTARPRKEALFVQVLHGEDQTPLFFPATEHVGKPMPFAKWVGTCAMRAKADTVAFSYLCPSKTGRATIAERPLAIPHGPLSRLERSAEKYAETLTAETLIVELDDVAHTLTIERDPNGLISLDAVGEDIIFELPKAAVRMSLYLKSPKVDRVLAISAVSYLGKPGTPEGLVHAASKNLYALAGLQEFRFLSGIESVKVGAGPARGSNARPSAKVTNEVRFETTVHLFEGAAPAPISAPSVLKVIVDLENMSHTPGRLLLKLEPSEEIAERFEGYRENADLAINALLSEAYGGVEQITALNYEIVLGEVSTGSVERLSEAGQKLPLIQLNTLPGQWRAA